MCVCKDSAIVLCADSSAALGIVMRKEASRRSRHVDTKIYFMQAWAIDLGQRIVKVHGNFRHIADSLTSSFSLRGTGIIVGLGSGATVVCAERRLRISPPTTDALRIHHNNTVMIEPYKC